MRSDQPVKAASVIGLLSRLDPDAIDELLPQRLHNGGRSFHDAVVRQLSTAGAPERGKMLINSLENLDMMALPLALDEIGMCGDPSTAAKLLRLAEGEILPEGPDYIRVKAIEALGRMRAPAAAGHLRHFVESKKTFGWNYPEEIRMAAAQALVKLDPEWMQAFLAQSGLDKLVMALAPLDAIADRDVVRHRRYRRIRLPRTVPAVISSARGKYSSTISVLSLEGGLLSGDIQLAVGTEEATLKIPAGLRSISMQAVEACRFDCVPIRQDSKWWAWAWKTGPSCAACSFRSPVPVRWSIQIPTPRINLFFCSLPTTSLPAAFGKA